MLLYKKLLLMTIGTTLVVDSKLEMDKEAFVTYLKEIFRYLPGITEESCKKLRLFCVADEIRTVRLMNASSKLTA